jgi:hypothetical protein
MDRSDEPEQPDLPEIEVEQQSNTMTEQERIKAKKFEEKLKRRDEYKKILDAQKQKQTGTPYDKIKSPINADYKNIVLVLTGSFYPIHNNHIRMLTVVRDFFENDKAGEQYSVVGGYIMPTHGNSLKKKMGVIPLEPYKRVGMLQAAVEDSDWIMVDPYLVAQKSNSGLTQAVIRLQKNLNEQFGTTDVARRDKNQI